MERFTKKNFVEYAADEFEISVAEYLKNTPFNYVIFYKGKVDTWNDGYPVIYGDEGEVMAEIEKSHGLDENGKPTADWDVMTEWDFICKYCFDWLVTYIANNIANNDDNEYDGNCWIHYLDEYFNNLTDLGENTDIIGAYVGYDGALSFLVSNSKDSEQTFVGLGEFDNEVIYRITMNIFNFPEYKNGY